MLVLGSGNAAAQTTQPANINYSLKAGAVSTAAAVPIVSAVQRTVTTTSNMFSTAVGAVVVTMRPT